MRWLEPRCGAWGRVGDIPCILLKGHPGRPVVAKVDMDCGGSGALHSEGTLTGQLKLKWVEARVTWGALHRGCPGREAGDEVGTSWKFLGYSLQGAS